MRDRKSSSAFGYHQNRDLDRDELAFSHWFQPFQATQHPRKGLFSTEASKQKDAPPKKNDPCKTAGFPLNQPLEKQRVPFFSQKRHGGYICHLRTNISEIGFRAGRWPPMAPAGSRPPSIRETDPLRGRNRGVPGADFRGACGFAQRETFQEKKENERNTKATLKGNQGSQRGRPCAKGRLLKDQKENQVPWQNELGAASSLVT